MKVEQIYTGCLAQGAYYITSNGEAAIIDPLREVQPYLDRAKKDNVKINKKIKKNTHSHTYSQKTQNPKIKGNYIVRGVYVEMCVCRNEKKLVWFP